MKYLIAILFALSLPGCDGRKTSDDKQQQQQEKLLEEGTAQTGMPAIQNFRERKIVKELLELRDQNGLVTYTYVFSPMLGKFVFIGDSVGYGIPAATQFTNPQKIADHYQGGYAILPQADPNGLFSPSSAEGTWVMMLNPVTKIVEPQYIEERTSVFTYKLPARLVVGYEVEAPEPATLGKLPPIILSPAAAN